MTIIRKAVLIIFAIAIIVAGVMASTARANEITRAYTYLSWTMPATPPPCGSSIRIEWAGDDELREIGELYPDQITIAFALLSPSARCGNSIKLVRDEWALFNEDARCRIVAHEVRHLYGVPHSDNPNSIMYRDMMVAPFKMCDAPLRAQRKRVAARMRAERARR